MHIPLPDLRLASPGLRDRFLLALDTHDNVALNDLSAQLLGCANILPSSTCVLLGLKPGSTYGEGAAAVRKSRS